jgi:hypothetical protein
MVRSPSLHLLHTLNTNLYLPDFIKPNFGYFLYCISCALCNVPENTQPKDSLSIYHKFRQGATIVNLNWGLISSESFGK